MTTDVLGVGFRENCLIIGKVQATAQANRAIHIAFHHQRTPSVRGVGSENRMGKRERPARYSAMATHRCAGLSLGAKPLDLRCPLTVPANPATTRSAYIQVAKSLHHVDDVRTLPAQSRKTLNIRCHLLIHQTPRLVALFADLVPG